jgi:hypothetical protein
VLTADRDARRRRADPGGRADDWLGSAVRRFGGSAVRRFGGSAVWRSGPERPSEPGGSQIAVDFFDSVCKTR